MEKYSEYKDSGVQWLGEIPSHWEIRRIKWLFKEEDEKNSDLSYQLLTFSRNKGIIPFADVNDKAPSASDLTKYKVLHPGQLLENRMQAWSGMFGCSYIEGCVSPDYSIFSPYDDVSTEFYAHLFRTKKYVQQFANASKGIGDGFNRLYTPQFHKIIAVYPSYAEQQAIVSYLDDKCGKIDQLLENKAKELELLAEMKQRVIADAVTNGLNPDVTMKDSGIPWLPQIPEHWEIRRLKSLFNQRSEKYNTKEHLQVLSLLKDVGVIPYSEKGNIGNKSKEDYSSYNVTRRGDIVMNSMNVIIGSVDITNYDGYISPAYYALFAKEGVSTEYFNYIFHLKACQKHMRSLANGILEIRLRISTTNLFGMYYPVPPFNEQKAIVAHIEEKVSKIDALAVKLQKEIESIKEYKQRLISDVVTGQIKVC